LDDRPLTARYPTIAWDIAAEQFEYVVLYGKLEGPTEIDVRVSDRTDTVDTSGAKMVPHDLSAVNAA
jgi:hypothetical protein